MIWKALADPTRRNIINLLQKAPLTTGELSNEFGDLSRFAVMKHLGVLEEAQLIRTRKEGKFRWNYLNPSPIQRTYNTWLKQLIQLSQQTMPTMGDADSHIMTATFNLVLELPVPTERVWTALTAEMISWWPRELLNYKNTTSLNIETTLGGVMVEKNEKEDGYIWAQVIGLERAKKLMLKGHLTPKLGGPAISFLEFDLAKKAGKSCELSFSGTLFGDFDKKTVSQQRLNWERLLKKELMDYVSSL